MPAANDDPILDGILAERKQKSAAVVGLNADTRPDEYAERMRLAQDAGTSPTIVGIDAKRFRQQRERKELDALNESSPLLAAWLTKEPDNYPVAKDDLPALTKLAQAITYPGYSGETLPDLAKAFRGGIWQVGAAATGGLSAMPAQTARRMARTQASFLDRFGLGDDYRQNVEAGIAPLEAVEGAGASVSAHIKGVMEREGPTRQTFGTDVAGALGQITSYVGASMLNPQAALLLGAAQGADIQGDRARQEGVYGTAEGDNAAALGAVITAVTERLGVAWLLRKLPEPAKARLRSRVADILMSGAGEAGQEITEGVLQNAVTQALIDEEQTLFEGAGHEGATAGVAAAIFRMALGVRRAGDDRLSIAAQGAEDARRLGDIVEAAKAAKLGQRAPGKLEALVGDMADETVYVPASALRTLYQGDAAQFVAQLTGEPEALALAGEYGDVAIPMAKWVAAISPMDNAEEWVRNSRTDPEGLTAAEIEATDWDAELGPTSEAAEPTEGPNARDRIQQDVFGMLHSSGRYRDTDAELQAKLVAMRYGTLGDRLGVDPWEVYSRHKLRIGTGEAAQPGLFQKMLDGAKRLFQPAFHGTPHNVDRFSLDKIGTGEGAQAFGHGLYFAGRQDVASHYRKSTSSQEFTRRARDAYDEFSDPDEAIAALQEQGLNDDQLALLQSLQADDWLGFDYPHQAIQAALRRDPGFDYSPETQEAVARMGRLYQVEVPEDTDLLDWDKPLSDQPEKVQQALGEFGWARDDMTGGEFYRALAYDFASSPADASAQLLDAGIPGLRYLDGGSRDSGEGSHNYVVWNEAAVEITGTLNQSAVDQTETPAFREWFGDSKVVDAEGKPLVVYHGTGKRFSRVNMRKGAQGLFWMTSDRSAVEAGEVGASARGVVMDLYAKIENPAGWAEYDKWGIGELKREGYDGLILRDSDGTMTVVAFEPGQVKSADRNRGTFDPNDPSILRQADGSNAPRGQMSIGPGGISIDLLANADRSTFLHELGHLFLEDLAEFAGENAEIGADFDTLLQWGGIAGETAEARLATWQGMDLNAQRELHEAFAENFEQYLLEGKAPSPELRSMFGRFRAWLRSLYGEMRKARIPLTDEVRAVMDRMLASDEEIEAAQVRQGFVPLFDRSQASELGLTDKQFEAYAASLEAATEEARQEVFGKLYKAHQREAEAWWKEEVAAHREEVVAEFEALPAVRAWRVLSGRGPEGSPALKLDRDAVYALLPERAAWIKARILPLGVYSREGGVHPDEAAAVLGFRSGAELLDALGAIPPNNRARADRFDAEAKDRMRGKHPDPMMDGSMPEAAQDAVHKNKRVQALENELGLLAKLAGAPAPSARVLNEVARRAVAKKTIRKLRPNEALAAERKAAREAMKAAAKGDYAAALQAKREQVLQAAMYRAARDAQDRADKAIRYLRRMSQDKARAKLGKAGADYLDQVDALLDRFDFRPMTGKAADRRASFAEWVKAQEDRGVSLDLDPALLDEANRKPHIEMTVGELDGLRDAVKQLDHLATLKGKLLLAGEIRDAAEIDDAMATSVREHNADRPETTGDRTNSDKLREALIQGRALQGTATDLARELDGFTDGGPVWTHVVMPVREAMNRLRPALRGAQEALSAIYLKHYTKAEIRAFSDRRSLPEVNGDEWSKRRILSLAMNWGNEGNREAILSQARNRLSPEQVSALLGRLDARDWAFVQDVWELVDAQWPAIAEAQKRRTGLVPEKVESTPFAVRTSDGQTLQLKGGYFPLKYEPDSVKSMRDEAEDFWNAIRMGRSAKAATRRGHTIERVGSGGRTVSLELGLVQTHLRDVLRDIHLGDAVNYVHNTLNGHGFAEALGDTGMLEHRRALEVWLKDVASGEIAPRMRHEQVARAIRQNFTASVLAWKAVSAAIQVTGIVQSSVVLGQQETWAGVVRYLRRPKAMTRYVTDASEMMRERANTHVEAVQQVMDAEAGMVKAGHAAMLRWGYFMMGQIQRTVDVSTWIAAEAKGLELFGGDVDKARAYADDVVIRAQATQEFVDKTPLQRGTLSDSVRQSEYIRATTALASYMLAKGNIAYERTSKTNFRSPAQALRWSRDMMILFAFEAMIVTAIRGQWPEDEDEDGWLDDVSLMAMEETFFGAVGGIPGISSISGSLRGYGSGGIVASFADAGRNLYDQAQQGELDKAAIKAWLTVTGFATGIPSGQINKTIDAIAAERDGEDVNAVQYLTGPPYKN